MKQILNKEEGFTYIEALVSLLVSSLVLLLLFAGINQAKSIQTNIKTNASKSTSNLIEGNRQIEWHQFLNQLENYLEGTKNPQVASRAIYVKEWDEEKQRWLDITYQPPKSNPSKISRFKSNGNVTMLTSVHTRTFKKNGGWLHVEVLFHNNETYSGRIWIESWAEE